MSEATAKVNLDASGYEAGTDKIKRANRDVDASGKEAFASVGRSTSEAIRAVTNWGEKVREASGDVTRLAPAAQQAAAQVALLERAMRAAGGGTDEEKKKLKDYQQGLRELQTELSRAEKAVRAFKGAESATRSPAPGTPTPMRSGDGDALIGSERGRRRIALRGAVGSFDALANGASPLRLLEMEAPRIGELAGLGLGATVGISAAAIGIGTLAEKTVEAGRAATALKREWAEIGRAAPMSGTQAPEAIRSRIRELDDFTHKNAEPTDIFGQGYQKVKDRLASSYEDLASGDLRPLHFGDNSGHNAGKERRHMESEAEDLRASKLQEIVRAESNLNDLRERGVRSGKDTVRQAERELETCQKVAALEEEMGIPKLRADFRQARNPRERQQIAYELTDKVKSFHGQAREIERGDAAQGAEEDRAQKVSAQNIGLENALLLIKREGADVDLRSAEARLLSARTLLSLGPDSGAGYGANAEKVHAAEDELRVANRANAERREEYTTRAAISVLTERADDRHLLSLSLEEQKLRSRLASPEYGADEKQGFRMSLMDNHDEQRDVIRERTLKANQGWLNQREATYDRGYGGQRQGILDRQTMLRGQMETNTAGTDAAGKTVFKDANLGAGQLAQAHQLQRALEDLDHTREQGLADAQEALKIADLQSRGLHAQAAEEGGIYEAAKKVAAARWDQNDALAAIYTKQADILGRENKLDAFLHPQKIRAERAEGQAHDRAERASDMSAGLSNVTRGDDGTPLGGYDVRLNENRATTPEERAVAMRAIRASPYTGQTRATAALGGGLIPDNRSIPDNGDIPDKVGPGSLAEYKAGQRPWATQIVKATPPERNMAEENRPPVPPQPKDVATQIGPLIDSINTLMQKLDSVGAKIGIA